MDRPAICIDIDNVIALTDEVMREVIRSVSDSAVDLEYEDVVCFDYWKCRDRSGKRIDRTEWHKIHLAFTLEHLPKIAPVPGVSRYLEQLSDIFAIHLATARLEEGRDATFEWLSGHHIPYDEVHFVRSGTKHLIQVPFVAGIEDEREQGYSFFSKGIEAFLLAHPWNHIGQHSPLKRVQDWSALTPRILSLKLP